MPQVPKPEMRAALLDAAMEEFARVGFSGAALAKIVAKAGTSIGNLYRYFDSKAQLFDAALPDAIGAELVRLLRVRVDALMPRLELPPDDDERDPWIVASDQLFDFAIAHRYQIVFLLRRSQQTKYESFAEDLARTLTSQAVEYAGQAVPGSNLTPSQERTLLRIYRAFLATIASILAQEEDREATRRATRDFSTYHLAGLKALFLSAAKGESDEQ